MKVLKGYPVTGEGNMNMIIYSPEFRKIQNLFIRGLINRKEYESLIQRLRIVKYGGIENEVELS